MAGTGVRKKTSTLLLLKVGPWSAEEAEQAQASSGGLEDEEQAEAAEVEEDGPDEAEAGQGRAPRRGRA